MLQISSPNPQVDLSFFENNYDRIYRYVLSLVRDPDEAEDLTQETFLRAHTHRDSLRNAEALVAWLYSIASHVCLDRLRQNARRAPREAEADLDEIDLPDPDLLSPVQTIEKGEMSACVQRHVDRLPDSYRAVILLHDQYGWSGSLIAEALGVTLSTVKIRLHRARQRLQAALYTGCAFSHDEHNILVCEPKLPASL